MKAGKPVTRTFVELVIASAVALLSTAVGRGGLACTASEEPSNRPASLGHGHGKLPESNPLRDVGCVYRPRMHAPGAENGKELDAVDHAVAVAILQQCSCFEHEAAGSNRSPAR